jgi:hypothetical protein
MKTINFSESQLEILKAVVSHVSANKEDAENELDISLEGILELETLIYEVENETK